MLIIWGNPHSCKHSSIRLHPSITLSRLSCALAYCIHAWNMSQNRTYFNLQKPWSRMRRSNGTVCQDPARLKRVQGHVSRVSMFVTARRVHHGSGRRGAHGRAQGCPHSSRLRVCCAKPPSPRYSQNHDTKSPLVSLKCLGPGSGRKIPAIWHGAGANPGVFVPET